MIWSLLLTADLHLTNTLSFSFDHNLCSVTFRIPLCEHSRFWWESWLCSLMVDCCLHKIIFFPRLCSSCFCFYIHSFYIHLYFSRNVPSPKCILQKHHNPIELWLLLFHRDNWWTLLGQALTVLPMIYKPPGPSRADLSLVKTSERKATFKLFTESYSNFWYNLSFSQYFRKDKCPRSFQFLWHSCVKFNVNPAF